eukprot:3407840-Pyramimonas_sp.AAC.1
MRRSSSSSCSSDLRTPDRPRWKGRKCQIAFIRIRHCRLRPLLPTATTTSSRPLENYSDSPHRVAPRHNPAAPASLS